MPGLAKVVVVYGESRLEQIARRQLQLGFEREGVPTAAASADGLDGGDAGLVLVGGVDGQGLDLVRRVRARLADRKLDVPVVFAGAGVARQDAERAGADEVVAQPAFLRDVVTIGRLLRGQPASQRTHIVGSLAEMTGVYTLVRALAALGRSAVLTLMRGLRRGEIRFFHGEVTSAQVGLIHGQAALHQLLLWTDARFDFRYEDVVRRQQIPMTADELFADAERFLAGVRDASGPLSPSMVLEQDVARIQMLGKQIPTEVHGVLRMFDGHRVLADVLEDSPYRVFETLRVAQRALDVGLLRVTQTPRPRATWRAVLAIEEWLVGSETKEGIATIVPTAADSGSIPVRESKPNLRGSRRKRKKRRVNTPLSVPAAQKDARTSAIDWGALVPRTVAAEAGPVAGVVPAAHASGEISLPTREAPREKLEALMDTGMREKIFPRELGIDAPVEPSVVLPEPAPAPEPAPTATASLVKKLLADERDDDATVPFERAPVETVDEPSDGIIREAIVVPQRDLPPPPGVVKPPDDRPEASSGEIAAMTSAPFVAKPIEAEPSILVEATTDVAAAQQMVAAAAIAQAAAPPTPDAATPARTAEVHEVRRDATGAFTPIEEEFFRAGQDDAVKERPRSPAESFDDLDEGYQPTGFWDKLLGRKPKR